MMTWRILIAWCRSLTGGEILTIGGVLAAVFVFLLLLLDPGLYPFDFAANWSFGPEWQCSTPLNDPAAGPICFRKPPAAAKPGETSVGAPR